MTQPQPPHPYYPATAQPPRKRKTRVFTWVILAVNALFLVWMVVGVVGAANSYGTNCGTLDQKTCEAAQGVGSTIGFGLLVFLWVAVDVVLGVLWLVTRKREPVVVYAPHPGHP